MKIKLRDGAEFEAPSLAGIATAIWRSSKFDQSPDLMAFIMSMSERIKTGSGLTVRSESAEQFIEDLLASGYAQQLD